MKNMLKVIGIIAAVASGCDDEETTNSSAAFTLKFAARVGDQALACGTAYQGIGTTASTWEAQDVRLYVHDVRLLKGDAETPLELDQDGIWQFENVALLDFEDRAGLCANGTAETNSTVRGQAPAGSYDGLRFRVGVPESLNHLDVTTAPAPLNLSGMYWSWTGGYKFLRVDGKTSGMQGFNVHLGSTMCQPGDGGVTCARANYVEVRLPGFDPATSTVVMDIAALLADANVDTNTTDTPMGCMSAPNDPDCDPIFTNLGISRADGTSDAALQSVFGRE